MTMRRIVGAVLAAVLSAGTASVAHAEPAPVVNGWACVPAITWHYGGPAKWRPSWVQAVTLAADLSGAPLVEAAPGQPALIDVTTGSLPENIMGATVADMTQPVTEDATGRVVLVGGPVIADATITLADAMQGYYHHFRRRSRPARVAMVMLHELGHALGLAHNTVMGDVMSPILTTKRVHPDDVAAFGRLDFPCAGQN